MTPSKLELEFEYLWLTLYPNIDLETEFYVIPKRKFRFDFVHTKTKIAIEINGGLYSYSGHTSLKGIQRDYEKLNLAVAYGWQVFQLSSEMITEYWLKIIANTILEKSRIKNLSSKSHIATT